MSGLFWAIRYEEFDGSKLPSFMKLSSQEHYDNLEAYMDHLITSMKEQLEVIKTGHLFETNFIAFLEDTPFFSAKKA